MLTKEQEHSKQECKTCVDSGFSIKHTQEHETFEHALDQERRLHDEIVNNLVEALRECLQVVTVEHSLNPKYGWDDVRDTCLAALRKAGAM